jgi:hypothetical protein
VQGHVIKLKELNVMSKASFVICGDDKDPEDKGKRKDLFTSDTAHLIITYGSCLSHFAETAGAKMMVREAAKGAKISYIDMADAKECVIEDHCDMLRHALVILDRVE